MAASKIPVGFTGTGFCRVFKIPR